MLGLITVSETYTHHNQNMGNDECVEQNIQSFRLAERAGIPFVMAVGMAFWCPYEGLVPEAQAEDIVGRFYHAGIKRQYLAGSIGMEDPHVKRLFRKLYSIPDVELFPHPQPLGHGHREHPAAMASGVHWLEGAICGIGGAWRSRHRGEEAPPLEDLAPCRRDVREDRARSEKVIEAAKESRPARSARGPAPRLPARTDACGRQSPNHPQVPMA